MPPQFRGNIVFLSQAESTKQSTSKRLVHLGFSRVLRNHYRVWCSLIKAAFFYSNNKFATSRFTCGFFYIFLSNARFMTCLQHFLHGSFFCLSIFLKKTRVGVIFLHVRHCVVFSKPYLVCRREIERRETELNNINSHTSKATKLWMLEKSRHLHVVQ